MMIGSAFFLLGWLALFLPESVQQGMAYLVGSDSLWVGLRLITCAFVHANLAHLVFNFLSGLPALWIVEARLGWRQTLYVCLASSMTATVCQTFASAPGSYVLGSSGVTICATMLALLLLSKDKNLGQLNQVTARVLVCALTFEMIRRAVELDFFSGIAHAAHLGGIIVGMLAYAWCRPIKPKEARCERRR